MLMLFNLIIYIYMLSFIIIFLQLTGLSFELGEIKKDVDL